MAAEVRQSTRVPDVFQQWGASLPQDGRRFRRTASAWADAIGWCQIGLVGLVVVGSQSERVDPVLLLRVVGLAGIATLLSRVFARDRSGAGGQGASAPRPLHAMGAVWLAFLVVMACRAASGAVHVSDAALLEWAGISGLVAWLIEGYRSRPLPITIVGDRRSAARLLCDVVDRYGADRIRVVAVVDAASESDLARLVDLAMLKVATVVMLPADSSAEIVSLVCDRLSDTPARVRLNVTTSSREGPIHALMRQPKELQFVDLLPGPIKGRSFVSKRAFDLAITVLLLLFLAPLLILVGLAIRLDTPGPILFRQWRFGRASRPILVYKFRSMAVDRSDPTGANRTVAGDARVTRVGRILRKYSIDELPQLLNVLHGNMSLVGPRPHATHMKVEGSYYFDAVSLYRVRHRILPGITGWAQVNYSRGEVDTLDKARRRLELDLWYLANWSPLLDLTILFRTLTGGFLNRSGD